jgi:hypothetical protein
MGFIATIKNFTKRAVKIDTGGDNIITAEHYAPAGDDSHPLETDYALAVSTPKKGAMAAIGYTDLKNDPKTAAGGKRIYARNKTTGETVAEIWLKNTSEIIIKNANGEIKLKQTGDVVINGVTITPGGTITASSITIGGIDFATHVHGGVTPGSGFTINPSNPIP